jgi:hypothetical protein
MQDDRNVRLKIFCEFFVGEVVKWDSIDIDMCQLIVFPSSCPKCTKTELTSAPPVIFL